MKNLLKRASMPIIVFGLAIGGVFATNVAKNAEMQTEVQGYLRVNNNVQNCSEIKKCTTDATFPICTWEDTGEQVYGLDGDMKCVITLYEKSAK